MKTRSFSEPECSRHSESSFGPHQENETCFALPNFEKPKGDTYEGFFTKVEAKNDILERWRLRDIPEKQIFDDHETTTNTQNWRARGSTTSVNALSEIHGHEESDNASSTTKRIVEGALCKTENLDGELFSEFLHPIDSSEDESKLRGLPNDVFSSSSFGSPTVALQYFNTPRPSDTPSQSSNSLARILNSVEHSVGPSNQPSFSNNVDHRFRVSSTRFTPTSASSMNYNNSTGPGTPVYYYDSTDGRYDKNKVPETDLNPRAFTDLNTAVNDRSTRRVQARREHRRESSVSGSNTLGRTIGSTIFLRDPYTTPSTSLEHESSTLPAPGLLATESQKSTFSTTNTGKAVAHHTKVEFVLDETRKHPKYMIENWSVVERNAGRRLVKFECNRTDKYKARLFSDVFDQSSFIGASLYYAQRRDYIIISCISHIESSPDESKSSVLETGKESRTEVNTTYWVTATDIMALLSYLFGKPYSLTKVDKRKIRKMLYKIDHIALDNGFSYFDLQQKIMTFPSPSAIEPYIRTIRVFPWDALESIIKRIYEKLVSQCYDDGLEIPDPRSASLPKSVQYGTIRFLPPLSFSSQPTHSISPQVVRPDPATVSLDRLTGSSTLPRQSTSSFGLPPLQRMPTERPLTDSNYCINYGRPTSGNLSSSCNLLVGASMHLRNLSNARNSYETAQRDVESNEVETFHDRTMQSSRSSTSSLLSSPISCTEEQEMTHFITKSVDDFHANDVPASSHEDTAMHTLPDFSMALSSPSAALPPSTCDLQNVSYTIQAFGQAAVEDMRLDCSEARVDKETEINSLEILKEPDEMEIDPSIEEREGNDKSRPLILTIKWNYNEKSPQFDDMTKEWSTEEFQMGRRVVRISRDLVGNELCILCEPVFMDASHANMSDNIMISCIRWPHTNTYWFSSDELITVLELLLRTSFSKTLRRSMIGNLALFGPVTVSKEAAGTNMFYRRVVSYSCPKVKVTRKELEILPWDVLAAAVDRVVARDLIPVTYQGAS